MEEKTIFDGLSTHFTDHATVKHFAYDENQVNNEANEVVYERPALFIKFKDREEIGVFRRIEFAVLLETKTLERANKTFDIANEVKAAIEDYTGDSGEKIGVGNITFSHRQGNAPVHVYDCVYYARI